MSEERIKDMIELIPNWEATYRYDGSRTCGKSYIQSLLDEKDKEIERLNNIINKARRKLGEYKHYSTPTEEQNKENEDISEEVYQILHENLYEIKN